MNELVATSLAVLVRTSGWLSLAAMAAFFLLHGLGCRSPAVHRAAWCIVLLTGWSFARVRADIPWYDAPPIANRLLPVPLDGIVEAPDERRLPAMHTGAGLPPTAETFPIDEPERHRGYAIMWPLVLTAGWLLGALAIVAWWSVGYIGFVRNLPIGLPTQAIWDAEWRHALLESELRLAIRLCVTHELGPLVCRTWGGYRLLVPERLWRDLSPRERVAILRHELAHVRRGDLMLSLLARCLALPHWFNPFSWWALRRFEECGEWACDDAIDRRAPADALAYAKVLLRLGQTGGGPRYGAAIGGKRLSLRIKRLLSGALPEDSIMKKSVMLVSIGLLALASTVEWRLSARAGEQNAEATRGQFVVDRELLQRMADNAAKTYEATAASYDVGTEMMSNVYVWSQRWLEAERALAKADADELAALAAHRERMKHLMLKVWALYRTGTKGGEAEKFFATRYYLAEADVWLAAAKNRGAVEPAPLEKVQVSFKGPKGTVVRWNESNLGAIDSAPLALPGTHKFVVGVYFLQLTGFGEHEFSGTLDLATASDETLPIEINALDLKRIVLENTGMTKVVYRTADSGIETASGVWGEADPVADAKRQGEILAILSVAR